MFKTMNQSSFTIKLAAVDISRYRISFLNNEVTIPHLDLRSEVLSQEFEL